MAIFVKQRPPKEGTNLMGLERYNMSVFPNCVTTMEIPIVNNRYNIGLEDKKLRERFEKHFGVTFDSPEGEQFLSTYEIKINHDISAYDIKNPKDAFDLHVLKVNGRMGIVATSEVEIENSPVDTFKFIASDEYAEVEERVKGKESKTQAFIELGKLKSASSNRINLLAKYIFGVSIGVGNNKDTSFDKLYDYVDKSSKNAIQFLDIMKIEPEYLQTVVSVREAIYRNIIRNTNGQYVLFATQTPLGRNEEEIIRFCADPANQDIMGTGSKNDSPTSIMAQLKQYTD